MKGKKKLTMTKKMEGMDPNTIMDMRIARATAPKVPAVKKTGFFKGKSNKLGYGGRSAQLKAKGVPGYVIGKLARLAQAAPGQKNYHGKRGKK